ncbi:MAG TPA: ABC transporter permease subunit, partial [Halothiobacillus sp.]
MTHYILKRLLLMIPTLFGILALSFAVVQFVPGGPVEQLVAQLKAGAAGGGAGAESGGALSGGLYRGDHGLDSQQLAQIKAFYGFDQPAWRRFGEMVGHYLTFNLGQSYFYQRSVTDLILEKLPVSISIGLWTFFLTYLVSIPLGIAKAVRDGSRFDTVTSTVILVGYAIPGFVLGLVLIVLFGGGSFWQWFPLRGLTSENFAQLTWFGKLTDYLWHLVLPVTAMVVGNFAVMTMLTK